MSKRVTRALRRLVSHSLVTASLSFAAVQGAAADERGARASVDFAPTSSVLVLIPGSEAAQALSARRPAGVDPAGKPEAELLRECANDESQRPLAARGFLWSVLTQGWRVLFHPLAVSVHEELQKYAAVSDATASGDYYRGGDPSPAAPLNNRISCLRFTRFVGADAAPEGVALDFVASVRLDAPRDAIRLRPLRLFISRGGAKSVNGHYSVAISVRADAVWRDELSGHHDQVFEETIASESVDLNTGSFLKYYPTEAASGLRVPIVPMSFGADRNRDFGRAEFGVRVAEVGTAPATLKLLADILPDPDEKMAQLVVAAAVAGVHLQ
ncbi:MAG TPA: hypothetical protein VGP32_10360 [Steroidobacteraceae bacterium]|jgi:hypothetical protein|nr:hypothetical protein [Steroidobacteraceae bacterium]